MRKRYLTLGLIALSLTIAGCGKQELKKDESNITQTNNNNTNDKDTAKTNLGSWFAVDGFFEGKEGYCIDLFSDFNNNGQKDFKEAPLEFREVDHILLPFDSGEEDSSFRPDGDIILLNLYVNQEQQSKYGVEYTDRLSDVPELLRSANIWDKKFANPAYIMPSMFSDVYDDFADGDTTFTPSESKEVTLNGIPFIREIGELDITKDENVAKFNYVAYYYVNYMHSSLELKGMGMMLWTVVKDIVDPNYPSSKDLSKMIKNATKYIDQLESRADASMNTLTPESQLRTCDLMSLFGH